VIRSARATRLAVLPKQCAPPRTPPHSPPIRGATVRRIRALPHPEAQVTSSAQLMSADRIDESPETSSPGCQPAPRHRSLRQSPSALCPSDQPYSNPTIHPSPPITPATRAATPSARAMTSAALTRSTRHPSRASTRSRRASAAAHSR